MMNMNLKFMKGLTRYVIFSFYHPGTQIQYNQTTLIRESNHSGELSYITIFTRILCMLATHQCSLMWWNNILTFKPTSQPNRYQYPSWKCKHLLWAVSMVATTKLATYVCINKLKTSQSSLVFLLFKTIIKFPHLVHCHLTNCMYIRGAMTLTIT